MKKIISNEIKNNIINKFNNGISMRKLESEYSYSFSFIQNLIKSENFECNIDKNYPIKNGYGIIAMCKKTKKIFTDYKNNCGAITTHIFSLYPEEKKLSKFKRKSIEYSTGKFWYDKYFDFIYEPNTQVKTKKCPYCDWKTEDIENKSGAFEKHLKIVHNLKLSDYIKNNPDDIKYFKKEIFDDSELVTCKICGNRFKIITDTHLKKHNINLNEYKIKYDENVVSINSKRKLSNNAILVNSNMIKSKTSKPENEIKEFLLNNGINVLQSKRKYLNGIEIDLYNPENMIGIEYNGNIYHSELYGKKNKTYHLNKSILASEKGIKLYHIHEDEWEYNKEIVKNKLLHLFKIGNKKRIYARNCDVKFISTEEKKIFLDKNHLQGNDKSNICIGAYYMGELCSVMTFTSKRNMNNLKNNNITFYDLTRFASDINYNIVGIASKLLHFFIVNKKPTKIITFADRRWTPNIDNNLYTKIGFKCTEILAPDYSYYKKSSHRGKRLHKFGFGKSNLKKRFPDIFDNKKTEWEMMQELGYDRIWDCGKFKYELNF